MRARLTYQDLDGKAVTTELSPEVPATIGRSRDNTVVLRDEHASRLHARIHFEQDEWRVRDFGLNGTRVNGVKVDQEAPLRHGDEVRVGDTRMTFSLIDPTPGNPITKRIVKVEEPPPSTRLQHDDLTTLCNFMAAAVRQSDQNGLLRLALDAVLHKSNAYLAGFLSDDPNDPVARMVLPETAQVDVQLSKQLIKRAHRDDKPVWLNSDIVDTRTPDSLANYSDALCLPVRAAGRTMGTLHVYRTDGYFAERDLRFCEALVGYLAGALQLLRTARALAAENTRLRGHLPAAEEMVGHSAKIRELREVIARVAPKARTVLIHGETGAGKELVAVALHRQSAYSQGPLVTVNCAAIPSSMMEAELFGYRKGAFTGADRDHPGFFGQAEEGTLFLDEIADLSHDCQAKLLRALDGRGYRSIGDTRERPADLQLIAATHRDLGTEVAENRFRADLYYRLKVVTIDVPPLRAHAEDIPLLVQYFLDKFGAEHHRRYRLTDAAVIRVQRYPWPGNVRQLRAVLENATIMAIGEEIDVADLRLDEPRGGSAPTEHDASELMHTPADPLPLELERLEQWAVAEALRRAANNKTRAAELLGINRATLYQKIERFKLDANSVDPTD